MKNKILITCLILIFSIFLSTCSVYGLALSPDTKLGLPYEYNPQEGSIEELYKDIIVRLIEPYVTKEIEQYYGKPYLYDLWNMKFLQINRLNGYRSFTFTITVEVRPFIGAHNTIGVDKMTIRIERENPTVENFKHIKSFPIPKHLQ